ncbi:hypothetical protein BCV70DRAFT_205609 [Testicularia cyperi]|uniref:Spindle pole body component n=1 Tax=Testicularia cyperi TaxID=1882483 RepID=A0A317XRR5_9BASI|nr:hypothetical protein BCV70DRAFT_205609 [Testicularia cyperi]
MAPSLIHWNHGPVGAGSASYAPALFGRRAEVSTSTSTLASATPYTVLRVSSQMDEHGDFNGTCTKEEALTVTPETPEGSCASYFADVTDYCCAAVGGIYNSSFRAVNVSEEQAMALDHPICETTNYADMFSCYQYVTETHCSGTTPVPYGVCNRNGPDTSRAAQKTSSANGGSRVAPRKLSCLMLLYAGTLAVATALALRSDAIMSSDRPSSSRPAADVQQPLYDEAELKKLDRMLGKLTQSFVPATRKKAGEEHEQREARRRRQFELEDKEYKIIYEVQDQIDRRKARYPEPGPRTRQDQSAKSIRRKLIASSNDTQHTARLVADWDDLYYALLNAPEATRLRNLPGMLEFFEALSYTESESGALSATPVQQGASSRAASQSASRAASNAAEPRTASRADPKPSSSASSSSSRHPGLAVDTPASAIFARDSRLSTLSDQSAVKAVVQQVSKPLPAIAAMPAAAAPSSSKVKAAAVQPVVADTLGRNLTKTQLLHKFRTKLGKAHIPEADLLRDVLFLLQGISGRHVRFEEEFCLEPVDHDAGATDAGPSKILRVVFAEGEGETGYINAPTKRIVHRLAELGQLYKRVTRFSQERTAMPTSGLVMQSLCHFISSELTGFYQLIATLEAQAKASATHDGSTAASGEAAVASTSTTHVTLKRLALWTEEMTLRFRLMSTIVESCQDAHGGSLISLIHSYTFNGDPFIRKFTSRLLDEVSKPFFHSLSLWIYEGELQDPFQEFFVELNDDPRRSRANATASTNANANISGADADLLSFADLEGDAASLWQNKFLFRKEMLPSFLQESFGRKIFSTGKSLNFIRQSCGDGDWVATRHKTGGSGTELRYTDLAGLESTIEQAFASASKRLLDIFLDDFRLLEHLRALKDYLMLSRGDFVDLLMSSLGPSLNRPANSLFRHNLTASLETAVRGSNAQYDDPDIVRRIDARILEFSVGDTGWDTFTLEYKVDSPVNTVLDGQAMIGYQTIFSHLWKMKRVELALNSSWLRLHETGSVLSKQGVRDGEFWPLSRLTSSTMLRLQEMIQFIRQLQGFAQLEVIEYSWDDLLGFFSRRQGDLDELIQSHRGYLNALIGKVLLRGGKPGSQDELAGKLRAQFDTILAFTFAVDDLTHHATRELARRDLERGTVAPASERGARSRTTSTSASSAAATPNLVAASVSLPPADPEVVARVTKRLQMQSDAFQTRMRDILYDLEKHTNLTVRDLAVRLNFNGRYEAEKAAVRKRETATPAVAGRAVA